VCQILVTIAWAALRDDAGRPGRNWSGGSVSPLCFRSKTLAPVTTGDHGKPSNWLFLCVMKLMWRCNSSPLSPNGP